MRDGTRIPADTKYFEPSPAPFMINFRVRDLDAMLAQLRAAGNRLEPWEPPGQRG